MSRLSIRPRPLDIHKKLPILKSVKDFEDDDTLLSPRHSQFQAENEVQHVPSKRAASEIPTPQYVDVDTYVRDYAQTFIQPNSYLRGRGARAEIGDFVEYDLDNEDDDWLQELNKERKILAPEKLEILLFKLEVLDHKARERAGIIMPTLGSPIHTLLQIDAAIEALQAQSITYGVFQSIFNYWREKRERWQKPILRRLQPPPPSSDTNPFNVFRPREKAHRLHTRRMQRRENNAQSFEKLRQIRQNLEQAKIVLEAVIKREEKKRDVMEIEVSLQRIQAKYMHESELVEDSLALPGFPSSPCSFDSSGDEDMYSDDAGNIMPNLADSKPIMASTARLKRALSRRNMPSRWLRKLDPMEPVLLFTKPLDEEKLAAAGIMAPHQYTHACKFRGRIGRGGRIVFDRWNPFLNTPIDCGDTFFTSQN